ncbi:MAG: hypothetical protein ACP5PQ_01910 [Thermoproteota archaeon]
MGKPSIVKLGTIDCDMVETTPIVFQNRLYRFEYVRSNYKPNKTGIPLARAHIVRSKNLADWQSSSFNPVMRPSAEDKKIANENL